MYFYLKWFVGIRLQLGRYPSSALLSLPQPLGVAELSCSKGAEQFSLLKSEQSPMAVYGAPTSIAWAWPGLRLHATYGRASESRTFPHHGVYLPRSGSTHPLVGRLLK